ncbi:MAG: ATP-binding protein [Myxococcota bacterium]
MQRAIEQVAQGDLRTPAGGEALAGLEPKFWEMVDKLRARQAEREQGATSEGLRVQSELAELARRRAQMALLLESVDQGFVVVGASGEISAERSAIVDQWFGAPGPGARFWDWIHGGNSASRGTYLSFAWSELWTGDLVTELALEQLPRRHCVNDRALTLSYRPISVPGQPRQVLVVITDISPSLARERADRQQAETLAVAERSAQDPYGTAEFFDVAAKLVTRIRQGGADVALNIHTLKGNAAVYGLSSIVECCEALEVARAAGGKGQSQVEDLRAAWTTTMARLRPLLRAASRDPVVSRDELAELRAAVARGVDPSRIVEVLDSWNLAPVSRRLQQLGAQAQRVAERLDKDPIELVIEDSGVRIHEDPSREIWPPLVHLVRNAVDHGLEAPADRLSLGKSPRGRVELSAQVVGDRLILSVSDDGRGVDWERVKERAQAMNLPYHSQEALTSALLLPGFSTRESASEVSGRGVGLSSVRALCDATGGRIEIHSIRGKGTRVEVSWPAELFGAVLPSSRLAPPALRSVNARLAH